MDVSKTDNEAGLIPADPRETPLAYRVVRGSLWVAAGAYFNIAIGFLANLALARILTPEHFGIVALAGFFFSLLNLRPKVAVSSALAQRRDTTEAVLQTHLTIDFTAGILTILLAAAAIPVLSLLSYPRSVIEVVLAFAVIGVLDSLASTAVVVLERELQFRQISLASGLALVPSYVPALWLALHGGGYWSLVAQAVTFSLLSLVILWWVARRKLAFFLHPNWQIDRSLVSQMLRFGVLVGVGASAGLFLGQFDNFLVGSFAGLSVLGYYDRAYRIAQWPTGLITGVINRTAFYTYARLQDDAFRLQKTLTMTMWFVTALALPLALAIFAAAPDLIVLCFGEAWRPAAGYLRILVVFSLLQPLIGNANSLFVAVGRPKRSTSILVVQVLTLLTVGTPLTLAFGALGTAWGVGISFLVGLILALWYLRQVAAFAISEVFVVPGLAVVLTFVAYWLLTRSVDLNLLPIILRVMVKSGFAIGFFLGVLALAQRRLLLERSRYVWRLLRGGEGSETNSIAQHA